MLAAARAAAWAGPALSARQAADTGSDGKRRNTVDEIAETLRYLTQAHPPSPGQGTALAATGTRAFACSAPCHRIDIEGESERTQDPVRILVTGRVVCLTGGGVRRRLVG